MVYPIDRWSVATTSIRLGIIECLECHKRFLHGERFLVNDKRWSQMRGEDEVLAYHIQCDPRKEVKQ